MTADVVLLALVCLAALLLRLAFSFFSAADTRGVFWRLDRLKPRRWIGYDLDDCAVPAVHGYPVLFHWLVARLPRRWWLAGGYLVNAALDIVVAIGLYAACRAMRPDGGTFAIAATAVYLFTPALVPTNARMMAFNGRAFGSLLFAAYAASAYLYLVEGVAVALAGVAAVTVLVVLSSQFAFQVVVAATVGLAIGYRSWELAVVPPAALALAALPRGLGVREPLRYFAGLYRWQFRQRKNGTMPAARSRWVGTAWRHLARHRWRAAWHTTITASPQVLSVLYGPPVVVVVYFLVAQWVSPAAPIDAASAEPFLGFCFAVTATMLGATVLTSFAPFSILGQAERYLEYASPFAAVLAVALLMAHAPAGTPAVAILLAIGATGCLVNLVECGRRYKLLFGGSNALLATERAAYHDWLDRLPRGARLLPVPLQRCKTISTSGRLNGANPVRVLYDWLSVDGEPPLAYMERCMMGLAYTPDGFAAILTDYDFDAALIYKREAAAWIDGARTRDWAALVAAAGPAWSVIEEDDDYALLARSDPAA